jgi:hypothetical protein
VILANEYIKKSTATPSGKALASAYYEAGYDLNIEDILTKVRRGLDAGEDGISAEALRPNSTDLPFPPPWEPARKPEQRSENQYAPRHKALVQQFGFWLVGFVIIYLRVSSYEQTRGAALEDGLRPLLQRLRAERVVVLGIYWDYVEGDTHFRSRTGYAKAKAHLLGSVAQSLVVPKMERFSRHVRRGYAELWDLHEWGRPLAYLTSDSSGAITVADMDVAEREGEALYELRRAADWLRDHVDKLHRFMVGSSLRREYGGRGIPIWPWHELEAPSKGHKLRRIRLRTDGKRRAAEFLEQFQVAPTVETAARWAVTYGLELDAFLDYVAWSIQRGKYGRGILAENPPSAVHEELLVWHEAVHLEVCRKVALLQAQVRPSRRSSVTEGLLATMSSWDLAEVTNDEFGWLCRICRRGLQVRFPGSWTEGRKDVMACQHCRTEEGLPVTRNVPDQATWYRLATGRIPRCPGCRRIREYRLLATQRHESYASVWTYCHHCYGYFFGRFSLANADAAASFRMVISAVLPEPPAGVPNKAARPAIPMLVPLPEPAAVGFDAPHPAAVAAATAARLVGVGRTSKAVKYPELREVMMDWWLRRRGSLGWTLRKAAKRLGMTMQSFREGLAGVSMPRGRGRQALMGYPELRSVLERADQLVAERGAWRRAPNRPRPYPRTSAALRRWREENVLVAASMKGLAEFLGISRWQLEELIYGRDKGSPQVRAKVLARTGLTVFAPGSEETPAAATRGARWAKKKKARQASPETPDESAP